jgi:ribonuclease E
MLENEPTGSANEVAPVEGGGPAGTEPVDATANSTTRRTRTPRKRAAGGEAVTEEAATTPTRRRRRTASPAGTDEPGETVPGGQTAAAAPPAPATPPAPAAPPAPAGDEAAATPEPAPPARARRRKAAAPQQPALVEVAAPIEAAPTPVEVAPPIVAAAAAAGEAAAAAGEAAATLAGEQVRREPSGRTRRATTAVLFMAPEAAAQPGPATPAPEGEERAEPATEAAETVRKRRRARRAAAETAEAGVAEQPGPAVARAEQQAAAVARAEQQAAAVTRAEQQAAAPAEEAGAEEDHELEAEETEEAGRRRRRRGRRGRGRGKGTHDEYDEEEEAAAEAEEEEAAEAEEGEPLTRRRRKRRRKGAGDVEAAPVDGVPTVVRIREPRKVTDEVQGVAGSTRLEAKRQRRRDGREQRRTRPPILSESEFLARREAVDRVMAVRQKGDRTQIAVLEDGVLVEHYVSRASSGTMAGNVYLGKVQNVLPSMEAAFVDVGRGRNAVLYAGEVNWDTSGLEGKARSIEQALKAGDSVLVQVTKDPVGHKGARLTSHIALSGRHLVYVPNGNASGISRKLPDTERRRLRDILKKLVPDGAGVIVRTAAEGASEEDLARDVKRLQAQWDDIQAKASGGGAPALLYEEPDLLIRVVRDLFNEDFREVVVQGGSGYEMVESYLAHVSPDLVDRLHRHAGTGDLFAEKRIDEQILKGLDRKVFLPSGGHLVIDRTEAMTVIDVNTGKYTGAGGNLEETVTRNNLEAAEEIVRQLRLRDLGGIVVIDFIDMVLESNRDLVLRRLTECLGRDRTKHQVTEITSLGLVQMTRKRIGAGLLEAFSETCDCCKGRGVIIHTEPVGDKPRGGNVAERVKAVASASAPVGQKAESGRRRGRKSAAPESEAAAARDATAEAAVAADATDEADLVAEPTDLVDVADVESTGSEEGAAAVVDGIDPLAGASDELAAEDEDDLDAAASGGRRRGRRGGRRRSRP